MLHIALYMVCSAVGILFTTLYMLCSLLESY